MGLELVLNSPKTLNTYINNHVINQGGEENVQHKYKFLSHA